MEHDADEIELHHLPKALRQLVEELRQIVVAREGLQRLQRGFVALEARLFFGS
jgi:hypothetical protein